MAIQVGVCIEESSLCDFNKLGAGLPRRFAPRNDGGWIIYPTTYLMTGGDVQCDEHSRNLDWQHLRFANFLMVNQQTLAKNLTLFPLADQLFHGFSNSSEATN